MCSKNKLNEIPLDSRNSNLAAIKRPWCRSPEIITMAAWLGIRKSCPIRIRNNQTLQSKFEFMFKMWKSKSEMYTSSTKSNGKMQRTIAQTDTKTVYNSGLLSIYWTFLRNSSFDAIYCAHSKYIRITNKCRMGNLDSGADWSLCNNYLCCYCEVCRKASDPFVCVDHCYRC